MKKGILFLIPALMLIVVISGCTQTGQITIDEGIDNDTVPIENNSYQCPGGQMAPDASRCPAYCGDGNCNQGENCSICPNDCDCLNVHEMKLENIIKIDENYYRINREAFASFILTAEALVDLNSIYPQISCSPAFSEFEESGFSTQITCDSCNVMRNWIQDLSAGEIFSVKFSIYVDEDLSKYNFYCTIKIERYNNELFKKSFSLEFE